MFYLTITSLSLLVGTTKCSCFIEFIKRVGKKRYNARLVKHVSIFRNEFNKVKDKASMYHVTFK